MKVLLQVLTALATAGAAWASSSSYPPVQGVLAGQFLQGTRRLARDDDHLALRQRAERESQPSTTLVAGGMLVDVAFMRTLQAKAAQTVGEAYDSACQEQTYEIGCGLADWCTWAIEDIDADVKKSGCSLCPKPTTPCVQPNGLCIANPCFDQCPAGYELGSCPDTRCMGRCMAVAGSHGSYTTAPPTAGSYGSGSSTTSPPTRASVLPTPSPTAFPTPPPTVACSAGQFLETLRCTGGGYQKSCTGGGCVQCPAGKYQPHMMGKVSCAKCGESTWSAGGAAACTAAVCPRGRFLVNQRGDECKGCPLGKYQTFTGQESCKQCAEGKFGAVAAAESESVACTPCQDGRFQNQVGTTSCDKCPRGKHRNNESPENEEEDACDKCDAGRYQDQEGQTTCKGCAAGKKGTGFSEVRGRRLSGGRRRGQQYNPQGMRVEEADVCNKCSRGQYQGASGASRCEQCLAGKSDNLVRAASRTSEANVCSNCEPGQSQPELARTSCIACLAGQYQSQAGASGCDLCLAGKSDTSASAASRTSETNVCSTCKPGRFTSQPGKTSCTKCPTGKIQLKHGKTMCTLCPAGRVMTTGPSNASSLSDCMPCPAGKFKEEGADMCEACAKGQFQGEVGSDSCADCPAGKTTPGEETGFTLKQNCSESNAQSDCRPGTYPTNVTSLVWQSDNESSKRLELLNTCYAAWNKTNLLKNTTEQRWSCRSPCADCPAGKYSDEYGRADCLDCVVGQYQIATGQTACTRCTSGKYGKNSSDLLGGANSSAHCVSCPIGLHQPEEGSTSCRTCGSGTEALSPTTCTDCRAGNFKRGRNVAMCKPCMAGHFQDQNGAASCSACPAGRFGSKAGETNATCSGPCQGGSYCAAGSSNSTAAACPRNAFCAEGSTSPGAVPRGKFVNIDNNELQDCEKGHACNDNVKTPCPLGSYQSYVGMTFCEFCPAGQHGKAEKLTSKECSGKCARGYYCGVGSNSSTAQACPNTTYCAEGSAFPMPVAPGKYVNNSTRELQDCTRGSYCAAGLVIPCEEGRDCDAEGLEASRVCKEGFVCGQNITGFTGFTPSAQGVMSCPAGFSCSGAKLSVCEKGKISDTATGKCTSCQDMEFAHTLANECKKCPTKMVPQEDILAPPLEKVQDGFTCLAGELTVNDGYFLVTGADATTAPLGENLTAVPCQTKAVCTNKINAVNFTAHTECKQNTTGVLCSQCIESTGLIGGKCVKCQPPGLLGFIAAIAMIVFFALYIKCVKRSLRQGSANRKGHFVTVASLKIFVTFIYQTSLLASYRLDWGASLRFLFSASSAVSSSDVASLSMGACLGWTMHFKIRALFAAPFLAAALPVPVIWLMRENKRRAWTVYHNAVMIAWWLMHPAILQACISYMATHKVGDMSYVSSDLSIVVGSPEHIETRGFVLFLLIVFVPGFPLYVFGRLLYYRKALSTLGAQKSLDLEVRQQLFFFYGSYKPERYYWEMVTWAVKALYVFLAARAAVAIDTSQVIYAGTWLALVAFVLEIKFEPYARSMEDRLVKVACGVMLCLLLLGQGLLIKDPALDSLLRYLSAGLLLGTISLFVYTFAREAYGQAKAKKKKGEVAGERDSDDLTSTQKMAPSLASFFGKKPLNQQTRTGGKGISLAWLYPKMPRGSASKMLEPRDDACEGNPEGTHDIPYVPRRHGFRIFTNHLPPPACTYVHAFIIDASRTRSFSGHCIQQP